MKDESGKKPKDLELPQQSQLPPPQSNDWHNSNQQNQQQQNQFQQQQQQRLALPGMAPLEQSQGALPGFGFFSGYQPGADVYDEALDAAGNLRLHWAGLSEQLGQIGKVEMEHRWKQIRRMVHQNGIAYSAYGDPSTRSQHSQLDPLPQLITATEWTRIKAALQQRSELLNLMLADLYGPRQLISTGVLPPDILFNHPHYHLPFHGLPTPGGKHVHFYSAEVVRSPCGNWWVKSDRTESPGGSGIALENRIAISRAFPNAFRSCNVQRLAPYFIALRENLKSLAKTNRENPHIAILSAGASSPRYFEDSFLARYLGFTLVETNDLVVRSSKLMLKTLAGLKPIDVIFRRHQGNSLDPLELGGSANGVPGILQVIREGNVVVANAPGSGLVESPIFMAFLPRVCKALMNTELLLPGVATWWGGEPDSLQLMLDRIDEIDLVPAYRERTLGGDPKRTANGSNVAPKFMRTERMTRDELINLLRNNPKGWVGKDRIARSSAAVWDNGELSPGYISMRTFLTTSETTVHALPGGMVRVSGSPYASFKSPFEGGGTKDTWVLADKPVEQTSLLNKPGENFQIVRSNEFLPSRIAENLCWLGRYLERADGLARLLRAIASRMTGETGPDEVVELPILIRALASSGQIDSGYAIPEMADKLPSLEETLAIAAINHSDPNSLGYQVNRIVSLAGSVRDRLSEDAWRIIQELSSSLNSSDPLNCDLVDLLDTIETLVVGLAAFSGFVSEAMTRTNAFRFLNIGRRLEHGLQIVGLLKNCLTHDEQIPPELLETVLEVLESRLTYRSRYYANLQLPAVLDLLLVDDSNPRSLAFQLRKLITNLEELPGSNSDATLHDRELARQAKKAKDSLQSVDVFVICKLVDSSGRSDLRNLLEEFEQSLPTTYNDISNRFFVHSGPAHQLIDDT